jgi:hypothetical protein
MMKLCRHRLHFMTLFLNLQDVVNNFILTDHNQSWK